MSLKIKPVFIALLALLLLGYWMCRPSVTTKTVHLSEFIKGVSFNEQMRFKVKDIVIGAAQIRGMFQEVEYREPTPWEYYTGKKRQLNFIVDSRERLKELRTILAAQRMDRLKVTLHDGRHSILRNVPFYECLFERSIEIIVIDCEEITRIIYSKIDSIIQEKIQKKGDVDRRINLDEVFDLLLTDEIESFITGLEDVKEGEPCFNTLQLLKELQGKDVPGFASGDYLITGGLKSLLARVVSGLLADRSNWARYNLDVKAIGYTDYDAVNQDKIYLRRENTGIEDWSKIEHPLDIRYDGCSENTLDSNHPIYIDFNVNAGRKIVQKINNNCELGAARAYVVTVYLINELNKLGRDEVRYSYATGGIYSSPDEGREAESDPEKRKARKRRVNIEFTIKEAKEVK